MAAIQFLPGTEFEGGLPPAVQDHVGNMIDLELGTSEAGGGAAPNAGPAGFRSRTGAYLYTRHAGLVPASGAANAALHGDGPRVEPGAAGLASAPEQTAHRFNLFNIRTGHRA
jgi:hypothetical protein